MKEENKTNNIQASPSAEEKEMALDDARRVKVLSPGMLVAKRFFRNKLAIIGLVILVVLFLFAFIGGLITPYSQTQVFKGMDMIQKDYAAAVYNSELRYTMKEGETLSGSAKSQIALATSKGNDTFEADGPRPDPLPARAGIHDGNGGHWYPGKTPYLPPSDSERDASSDCSGYHESGQHHHHRGDLEFPGAGTEISAGILGQYHQCG